MFKVDGYQENIISKVFERISNNRSLSQLKQQMHFRSIQENKVKMCVNLQYVEGASKKLRHKLRSHKIRSIFHTENILCKILCKPEDRVIAEDIKNTFMKLTVVTVKQ